MNVSLEVLGSFEKVVGHVAWPITFLVTVVLVKNDFFALLNKIKTAKYKDIQLDLHDEFQEIKSDADKAGITVRYPISPLLEKYEEAINKSPEWVFIESWNEIENILSDAAKKLLGSSERRIPSHQILNELESRSVIGNDLSVLVKKLLNLRNKVVHKNMQDPGYTHGEIIEWLGLSQSVKDRLQQRIDAVFK
ncbi:hypothetical protein [Desulfovibrio sp. JC022]|uniref:hypothetical protein n=1 Tax=Desulfovibrio sp. JC022 TaxID=2593642 RepID=UPI0013D461B1|nr:hypothetical protein [Desulfovibrio sp. JC022]NDV22259.1 hypothetical protein [Desulfovibrio sp. JC022]